MLVLHCKEIRKFAATLPGKAKGRCIRVPCEVVHVLDREIFYITLLHINRMNPTLMNPTFENRQFPLNHSQLI